jgi:hypothetical protein
MTITLRAEASGNTANANIYGADNILADTLDGAVWVQIKRGEYCFVIVFQDVQDAERVGLLLLRAVGVAINDAKPNPDPIPAPKRARAVAP